MNFIKWYELNHLWCCHFNIKKLNRNTDGAKMSPTTTISCPQCNAMPFDNLYCFAFLLLGRWSFIASPILRCGLFVNCNAWLSTAHNVFALLCYCSKMPCNGKGYLLHVLSPHPPTHPLQACYATATPLPSFRFTALQCNSIVPPIENLRTVLICHLLTVAIGIALNGIAHTLPFGLECCCALCYTS